MNPSDEPSSNVYSVLSLSDSEESSNPQVDDDHITINSQSIERTLHSASPLPQKRTKGRKKILFTKILELFCCRKGWKKPKKEYILTSFIRGIKKGFRSLAKGYVPTTSCFAVSVLCKEEMDIWEELRQIYVKDSDFIETMARTENGPIVDGKGKSRNNKSPHKCYTNSYCKEFLSNNYMQEAFRKLIDLIFLHYKCTHNSYHCCNSCINRYCNRCCSRLNFNCCNNGENPDHSDSCVKKWDDLRKYLSKDIFEELKVEILHMKLSTSDERIKFNGDYP